ncbi:hypothetical protein [Colwellia sp. MB3u-55]|jgi:hypothetical protein|uniref:hypothetical protein n=1 Tax=Colwellia sp. MB3u-55 TaxID=2759810 RepID=UPI0015F5140A|nr:hypothetical protein [Colwellia sp. MB3u-55]MBA6252067.1 hypothetical protein [Colwellia sp. MB3u-55]
MDIASITSAYSGLKIAKDIFIGFTDLKIEADSIGKINEAVKKVGDAQDALFQLREELFRLQEDNNSLKSTIKEFNSWEDKLAEYELVKTSGEAVVYKFKADPEHFICPSCVANKSIQILQDNKTMSGTFRCVSCNGSYPIKKEEKFKQIQFDSPWP